MSRAIVAVAVLSVLAGVSSVITVEGATTSFSIMGSVLYYYDDGAYHLLIWAYDAGGAPVSGVVIQFAKLTGNSTNVSAGPYTVTTDSQGQISLAIPFPDLPSVNLTFVALHLSSSRSVTVLWGGFFTVWQPPFVSQLYLGYVAPGVVDGTTLTSAGVGFYSGQVQAMVFAAGPNGTAPTGLRVETCSTPQGYFPYGGQYDCAGLPTKELGTVTGLWTHFPLGEYPVNATTIFVQLVNESGGVLQTMGFPATVATGGQSAVFNNAPGVPILNDFGDEMSFFFVGMAIVAAYWTYARPRLSGTVEPVLARPVTRQGLLLVRYASVAGVLAVAAIVEVLVMDAGVSGILGEPLPMSFLAPMIGGLMVAALGSAGLVFLISHIARSAGGALGAAIVPLVLGLFWFYLLLGILILNNPMYSGLEATTFLLPSQLFFPPQFLSLTTSLLTGLSPFTTSLGPSPGGVNFVIEAAAGVAWIVVPFLITYRLAAMQD